MKLIPLVLLLVPSAIADVSHSAYDGIGVLPDLGQLACSQIGTLRSPVELELDGHAVSCVDRFTGLAVPDLVSSVRPTEPTPVGTFKRPVKVCYRPTTPPSELFCQVTDAAGALVFDAYLVLVQDF